MKQAVKVLDDRGSRETLAPLKAPAKTFEQLCKKGLPTLAARVWDTCCWPGDWKIGEFKFLVLSISPDRKTTLYVQLWSEPHEQVLFEVTSGEWSPSSLKYVQQPQRRLLRAMGFEKGGQAKNLAKLVDVRNADEAEQIAREALRVFFEVFGYRAQWPLEIGAESGGRAEERPVLSSVTPEDFAKLLTRLGYSAIVPDVEDTVLVLVHRGRRRFAARLDGRVAGQDLYRAIILNAMLQPANPLSDESVVTLNDEIAGLTVRRAKDGSLRVSMLMLLEGGVTEEWLSSSVAYWVDSVKRLERMMRELEKKRSATRQPTRVH